MAATTSVVLTGEARTQTESLADLSPVCAESSRDANEVDHLQVADIDNVVCPRHRLEHAVARRDSRNNVQRNTDTPCFQFWLTHLSMLRSKARKVLGIEEDNFVKFGADRGLR